MPLHPASVTLLESIKYANAPTWQELPPSESRRIFEGYQERFGVAEEMREVRQLVTEKGSVRLRLYRPSDSAKHLLLYFHGGGWVIGNLNTHDALCRRLASQIGGTLRLTDSPDERGGAVFCLELPLGRSN